MVGIVRPMFVFAEISLVAMGLGCVVAFLLLMVFLVWANPGTNSGFLEWDAEAQATWRGELERADVEMMLRHHNEDRATRGLEPVSLEEFREELRRQAGS